MPRRIFSLWKVQFIYSVLYSSSEFASRNYQKEKANAGQTAKTVNQTDKMGIRYERKRNESKVKVTQHGM